MTLDDAENIAIEVDSEAVQESYDEDGTHVFKVKYIKLHSPIQLIVCYRCIYSDGHQSFFSGSAFPILYLISYAIFS